MKTTIAFILLLIPLSTSDRPIVVELPREVEQVEFGQRIQLIIDKPEL